MEPAGNILDYDEEYLITTPANDVPAMENVNTAKPKIHKNAEHPFISSKLSSLVQSVVSSVRRLRKSVGFIQGFSLAVGIIIGSGIFISPSLVVMEVNDVGISLIIWLLSGLIALIGGLCYCELALIVKKAGGNYAYILHIYGPLPAFLCAWNQALLVDPTGISAITLTLATYALKPFEHMIDDNPLYPKAIAASCIFLIALINSLSIKASTGCQTLFTTCQMLAILFIVGLGFWQIGIGNLDHFEEVFHVPDFDLSLVGSYGMAFFAALWAYNGWQMIGNVVEDMSNAERNLFLTIITAVPFVILSYITVNVAFFTSLSPFELSQSEAAAVDFVNVLLGRKVGYIMPIMVAISCYGCANGCVFACGRVSLASGREGHFPEILGMIHKSRHTPIPAIMLTSTISLLMLIPNSSNLRTLINFASICSWVNCVASIFGIIVLRYRNPMAKRDFQVWILAPILMTVIGVALIVVPFVKDPINSAIAIGLILLGLPVYFIFIYLSPKHPQCFVSGCKSVTKTLRSLLNLVPCEK